MFGMRTPVKGSGIADAAPRDNTPKKKSPTPTPVTPPKTNIPVSVRRSIGEWESGKSDTTYLLPNTPSTSTKVPPANPPKPKQKPTSSKELKGARRASVETAVSPSTKENTKYNDRIAEAKACVVKAKLHLGNSRNLKTEIKEGVTHAIDRLYQLVKEAGTIKGQGKKQEKEQAEISIVENDRGGENNEVIRILGEQTKLIKEGLGKMEDLKEVINKNKKEIQEDIGKHASRLATSTQEALGEPSACVQLLGEVRELRQVTADTSRLMESLKEATPSYAEVVSRSASKPLMQARPNHSIIVSSEVEKDTSDEVLGKVRCVLDARTSGLQVQRVRKVRNQKVVLSCTNREDMHKMAEKISSDRSLKVEEAKNKDPLVIIKDLLSYNTDDDIVASLKNQNAGMWTGLADDQFHAKVRYRRRARNPLANHVVLQVSPVLWQRLTSAGQVHIDLQRVTVQDQSPLVQCTRCLGYGHGRKLCREPADLCSYCGGPHHQAECPSYLVGELPSCRNCKQAKYAETAHNAFSGDCPIRKRWDDTARSSVAYC